MILSWCRVRSAATAAALLLLTPLVGTAQERAPVPSPSWRLIVVQARSWGTGGATPEGRGSAVDVLGRRRLGASSRFAVEFGVHLATLRRTVRTDEPSAPRPGPFADTSRTLTAIMPVVGLTADVARWGGVAVSLDGALAFGGIERRSRFGDDLSVIERVGDRPGFMVGATVRTPTGLFFRVRHLRLGTGAAAMQGVAVGAGVTLF